MFQEFSRNRIQHIIQLLDNLDISKPQEINAERLDEVLPGLISRLGPVLKMTISVDLNRKSEFRAIEVNNVGTHAVLATKLVAQHLAPTQLRPQDRFSAWHLGTQGSPKWFFRSSVVDVGHRPNPPEVPPCPRGTTVICCGADAA